MEAATQKRKIADVEGAEDKDQQPPLKKQKTELDEQIVEIQLPPEILVDIFKLLSVDQLLPAALVCRDWWICSKDEQFSWMPVVSDANLYEDNEHTYYVDVKNGEIKLEDLRWKSWREMEIDRQKYPTIASLRVAKFGEVARDAVPVAIKYLDKRSEEQYFRLLDKDNVTIGVARTKLEVPDLTYLLYRYSIVGYQASSPDPKSNIAKIRVEINYRRLERMVREGKFAFTDYDRTPCNSRWLLDKCRALSGSGIWNKSVFAPDEAYLPPSLPLITKQIPEIRTKMHNYQIEAVNWMSFIEQGNDIVVSPLIKVARTELWFAPRDPYRLVPDEKFDEHNLLFKPKGGVLADETGLGKTLEVIGLIMANKPPTDLPSDKPQFATRATLIICPSYMVQLWAKEFEKHVTEKLTILQASKFAELKKITYQRIIDADIVIVSFDVFSNKSYFCWPSDVPANGIAETAASRRDRVLKVLETRIKNKNLAKTKEPILDHFYWHRIVLDEGHRFGGLSFDVVKLMPSTYRWYVSATPDLSVGEPLRRFLNMEVKKEYKTNYLVSVLDEVILTKLLWRNTKASIANEYNLVDTKEELILLDPSPLDSFAGDEFLGKSLAQVKTSLIQDYNGSIEFSNIFIARYDREKGGYEQTINSVYYQDERNRHDHRYRTAVSTYNRLVNQIEDRKKSIEISKQAIEKLTPIDPVSNVHEVNQYGTRAAHILLYLNKLFAEDKTARAIIFGNIGLGSLVEVLRKNNITVALAVGLVKTKVAAISEFTEKDYHVIVMNIDHVSTVTNLIEASHVIFLDCIPRITKNIEAHAIGRAQRKGQERDVTVVRFLIKDSPGYERYMQSRAKPALHKTTSKLTRSGSSGALTLNQPHD